MRPGSRRDPAGPQYDIFAPVERTVCSFAKEVRPLDRLVWAGTRANAIPQDVAIVSWDPAKVAEPLLDLLGDGGGGGVFRRRSQRFGQPRGGPRTPRDYTF